LNLLKTGVVFADAITTVSDQYSREILEEPVGCGLAGVLQQRRQVLRGIANGLDYGVWNPACDRRVERPYDVRTWREGKAACKAALQSELGLPVSQGTPLIGHVGRLVDQKGWDLMAELLPRWAEQVDAQWVVLGSGEPKYQALLRKLAQSCARVAVRLEYSEALAHRIVAGSDMLVVPSRYEPCGQYQLVGLKYGSVPVVRSTGGLADTVRDANRENLGQGSANGFAFADYDVAALEDALRRATALFLQQPDVWARLVQTGMQQDWSWSQTAKQYIDFYARLMDERRYRSTVSSPG
jgi:starch synthase